MTCHRQLRRCFFTKIPKICFGELNITYIIFCLGAWLSLLTIGFLYDFFSNSASISDITDGEISRIEEMGRLAYPARELKNANRNVHSGVRTNENLKTHKLILLWTSFYGNKWNLPEGVSVFHQLQCKQPRCYITDDKRTVNDSDAVIVHGRDVTDPSQLPKYRQRQQRWVFYLLESPHHVGKIDLDKFNGLFNWTSTYSFEADIPSPYGGYVPYKTPLSTNIASPRRNYASGKTRLVAWFVTNCKASNHREEYVDALKQYVQVDVYGICDRLKCKNRTFCLDMLRKKYKFYLAFENSDCREYITEKFWHNALDHGIVPIVYGARKADYQRFAPPHSFIHIDDFPSARELARYLRLLDSNDKLYNQYFDWVSHGRAKTFVNFGISSSPYWCDLCSALHDRSRPVSVHWDLSSWWSVGNQCIKNT